MKTKVSLCFFLFVLFIVKAKTQDSKFGSWNILNLKYKLNKKINLFAEGQIRSLSFYNEFHYHEYKGGIDYKVKDGLKLTLGLGDYNTYSEEGNFKSPIKSDEFRIWPQVTLEQKVGKFLVDQRYRLEMRFTDNGYNNRFRYRIGVSLPFGKTDKENKIPYTASFYNEIFFTDKEPYFVRNRMSIQIKSKLNSNTSFMLGYLHQFDYKINDETGRDFLLLGFYFDLN